MGPSTALVHGHEAHLFLPVTDLAMKANALRIQRGPVLFLDARLAHSQRLLQVLFWHLAVPPEKGRFRYGELWLDAPCHNWEVFECHSASTFWCSPPACSPSCYMRSSNPRNITFSSETKVCLCPSPDNSLHLLYVWHGKSGGCQTLCASLSSPDSNASAFSIPATVTAGELLSFGIEHFQVPVWYCLLVLLATDFYTMPSL